MSGATRLAVAAAVLTLASLLGPAQAPASAPTIGAATVTNVQGTSALVKAPVNPEGAPTSVRFEYLTQSAYEAEGFTHAALTPAASIGSGSAATTATGSLGGLAPSTAYHFRARALNADGISFGADGTLTTTAGFGFQPGAEGFSGALLEADGSTATRAGTHPYEMKLGVAFRLGGEADGQPGAPFTDGDLRSLKVAMPPGLLINAAALEVPSRKDTVCSQAEFHTPRSSPFQESLSGEDCPDASQVGTVTVRASYAGGATRTFGLFNVTPRYGAPMTLGFAPYGVPIELVPHIREGDGALVFEVAEFPQRLDFYSLEFEVWGTPWATPETFLNTPFPHDDERGNCLNEVDPAAGFGKAGEWALVEVQPGETKLVYLKGTCSVGDPAVYPPKSLLTLPVACQGPISWSAEATSWQQGAVAQASASSPAGIVDCNKTLATGQVTLSTASAATGSGLDFRLEVNDGGGLGNPGGVLRPPIRKAVVTLPEGLTINPSLGAGLGVCTPAQFAAESLATPPGQGCPNAAKIGDIAATGLLGLPQTVSGSLYLAAPGDNPFGSLIALYMVLRSPERGLFVKSVGKVEADARTGQLQATFDDLPQLPYTAFTLHFREGQRAAMISPPACGSYAAVIELTPWPAESPPVSNSSSFDIARGEAGGPCPTSAAGPFAPQLIAGSLNPIAGAYSSFNLHVTRSDADQEITSYSATFPPGLLGKLAGVSRCSDAAIAAAAGRGAAAEEANPSCPANSLIGHTLAGYGTGRVLAYAPGALYLAGPYHGSPLSTVAITSAKVGPFDLGNVVVRSAIRVDPRTAQASIDSSGSDPIPHILRGIPLHLRDIRVYVDRPQFTRNPTSCDPLAVESRLTGAGTDLFSSADDSTYTASDRFQALGCSELAFAPQLTMRLRGGTKHGGYPSLQAVYRPAPGANLRAAAVTLPPSLFLAQEHIGTVCTRAQFAREACPPGSVYGRARAVTPLLGEPLEGPVYLRSSDNPLPDLVASLRGGGVEIEVPGRIDAVNGGLRDSFELLPDAPVTEFTMTLPGGKRGLLSSAADLCASPQRASVRMVAQNNKTAAFKVPLRADCRKAKKKKKTAHRRRPSRAKRGGGR